MKKKTCFTFALKYVETFANPIINLWLLLIFNFNLKKFLLQEIQNKSLFLQCHYHWNITIKTNFFNIEND